MNATPSTFDFTANTTDVEITAALAAAVTHIACTNCQARTEVSAYDRNLLSANPTSVVDGVECGSCLDWTSYAIITTEPYFKVEAIDDDYYIAVRGQHVYSIDDDLIDTIGSYSHGATQPVPPTRRKKK